MGGGNNISLLDGWLMDCVNQGCRDEGEADRLISLQDYR